VKSDKTQNQWNLDMMWKVHTLPTMKEKGNSLRKVLGVIVVGYVELLLAVGFVQVIKPLDLI